MRRSPGAWACTTCARSLRSSPSARSTRSPTRPSRSRLTDLRHRNRSLIESIERELTERLHRAGITAEVSGREKRPYSIFRKMERKAVSFEQLSDILGFRVIVGSVAECYGAVGVVHTTWPSVPGRFKDYISTPKQNDYRSIHTTVVGPGSQRVELQIRTAEMHRVAEFGIATHALYKDGVVPAKAKGNGRGNGAANGNGATNLTGFADEVRAYEWLRRTIEMLAEGDTPEEFLEHTKLELFQDQVFCFTPKGRLIALPRGATPIDFAYAVHTDIGDTCVGARVNGRNMPLMTELRNGDEVEIICSKGQVPPAAWESMVVTGKARSAIRRATRSAVRKQFAGLGRHILQRAFARAGRPFSEEMVRAGAAAPRPEQRRGRLCRRRARRDSVGQRAEGDLSRPQGRTRRRVRRPLARRAGSASSGPPA